MQQIVVDFEIISSTSTQAFQTNGTKDEHQLVFVDPENYIHELEIHDQIIVYNKTGDTILHLELDPTQVTTATYQINEQTLQFQVHTQDILISNGFIGVQYTLYQEDDKINETQFKLRFKTMKEDLS